MKMTIEEMGRRMMSTAGTLDDDAEFNRWAKLGSKLIGIGTGKAARSLGDLTPEEQQVLARAVSRFEKDRNTADKVVA